MLQAARRSSACVAGHNAHAAGMELPGLEGGSDDGLGEAGPGHDDDTAQLQDGDSVIRIDLDLDVDALPAAAGLPAGVDPGDTALPLLTPSLRAQLMAALWVTWEVWHGSCKYSCTSPMQLQQGKAELTFQSLFMAGPALCEPALMVAVARCGRRPG